jgi:hypothetical protein
MLSEYIDGVLPEDVAIRVEAHLQTCTGCTRAYDEMTRLVGYMREMETVDEPADFLDNVKAGIDRGPSPASWLRKLFYPPMVKLPAAAAVVVLVAMLVVFRPQSGGGPEIPLMMDKASEIADIYELTLTVSAVADAGEPDARLEKRAQVIKDEAKEGKGAVVREDLPESSEPPSAAKRDKKGRQRETPEEEALRSVSRDAPATAEQDAVKSELELPPAEKMSTAGAVVMPGAADAESTLPLPDTMVVEITADSLEYFLARLRESGMIVSEIPPGAFEHKGILKITVISVPLIPARAPGDTTVTEPRRSEKP